MIVFSRSFIRKRVISLATTASVAATSFALAQDPTKTYHVRGAIRSSMSLTGRTIPPSSRSSPRTTPR